MPTRTNEEIDLPVPVVLSWSGGKDCVLALERLRASSQFDVRELVSGFCRETGRIAIHEVRRELIRSQAKALGLPLIELELPDQASNVDYESVWRDYFDSRLAAGIGHVAYGDLFLQDIRNYREQFLKSVGMKGVFPLWGLTTSDLARQAIDNGLQAVLCSCDTARLGRHFAGRMYDHQTIDELPAGCDPCGENGEFHTFVFGGPGFRDPVPFERGDILRRGTVDFCDLIPIQHA